MKSKTIIVNGKQIEYFQYGNLKNPALLFLHGFHGNARELSSISQYLAQIFCVYSPNLPGFGVSSDLGMSFNVDNCAILMEKFLKKLGLKSFYLGGISLGGTIVTKMFLSAVGKVEGIILLHPLFCGDHIKMNPSQRKKILSFITVMQNPLLAKTIVPFIFYNDFLLKFILQKFSETKITPQNMGTRIRCIRSCGPMTYISGLKSLLTCSLVQSKLMSHKMLLFLNPSDSIIDPKKTHLAFHKLFPKTKKVNLVMENHHPEVIPTLSELQAKYPQILSEIKMWLQN